MNGNIRSALYDFFTRPLSDVAGDLSTWLMLPCWALPLVVMATCGLYPALMRAAGEKGVSTMADVVGLQPVFGFAWLVVRRTSWLPFGALVVSWGALLWENW